MCRTLTATHGQLYLAESTSDSELCSWKWKPAKIHRCVVLLATLLCVSVPCIRNIGALNEYITQNYGVTMLGILCVVLVAALQSGCRRPGKDAERSDQNTHRAGAIWGRFTIMSSGRQEHILLFRVFQLWRETPFLVILCLNSKHGGTQRTGCDKDDMVQADSYRIIELE